MKKIISAAILLCLAVTPSFSQFENEPDSRGMHAFLQFGDTRIIMTNNFVKSLADRKNMPLYTGLPAGELAYSITGPRLQVTIHEKAPKQNFEDLSALDVVIDSLSNDNGLFAVGDFQYKMSFNGRDITGWKSLVKPTLINLINLKGFFVNPMHPLEVPYPLIDTGLNVNDNVTIEFRDKSKKQLVTLHINRVDIETRPFLASITHDSSTLQSSDVFIQYQVNQWQKALPRYTSFYTNWPGGIQVNNQRYFPSSKLAFWFVKPAHYTDSSLEYKLTGGEYTDTSWLPSGHLIIVPRLQPNSNYTLLVRYKEYPKNIEKYTFYVAPEWYQKRAFIFFVVYPVAFFILFFTIVYYARLRVKKANERKAKLSLELKSIRAQLNPHFVFNALSSIQALINKNEVDLANQYLTDFSNLLRTSLQSHDSDLVPVAIDLKTLENYIKLEQLRFNFYYDIKTDEQLNLNSIEVPSLLLQPLIENAIKHGISVIKENGRLLLEYIKKEHALIIRVTDNGRGFNTQEISDDKFGLRLTKERILLLNKTFKQQPITMDIASDDNGTVISLTFNHWL